MIAKLISRLAEKFEILIKIVLSLSWETVFAIKRLVLARSWVRAPAESQREFSMRALFFLLVGLDDLVGLAVLVVLAVSSSSSLTKQSPDAMHRAIDII